MRDKSPEKFYGNGEVVLALGVAGLEGVGEELGEGAGLGEEDLVGEREDCNHICTVRQRPDCLNYTGSRYLAYIFIASLALFCE